MTSMSRCSFRKFVSISGGSSGSDERMRTHPLLKTGFRCRLRYPRAAPAYRDSGRRRMGTMIKPLEGWDPGRVWLPVFSMVV